METIIRTKNKTYDYGDRYNRSDRGPDKRKKTDGTKKGHVITEMWDSHHEIARRLLLGQKNVDIAKAMKCSEVTVSSVRNSPVVKEKLTIMKAARDCGAIDLAREIQDLAPIALERVKEAIETGQVHGKEVSAAEICKQSNTILDRQLGKATQKIDNRHMHGHFTMGDIEAIKARAKELSGANAIGVEGTVIDG